ncbi:MULTISPECIES: MarR family winged helix-turn-helix transcriptional regulator [unclassified Pseudoalteromonas]|uniref:MarR family winged helix-turn-helix transcriptional regulator n=1 Tax=unclassified Pseudoalteromonas TaxID=194690 RepID=UPI0005A7E99A|nr:MULTISPECIES: winged helix DNA-binding protein [unclassified Pseudoalteromonas]
MHKTDKHEPLILNQFFPYRFAMLQQAISENIACVYTGEFELSRHEWRVMAILGEQTGLSAKKITLLTNLEKMQISRAINSMRSNNLIKETVNAKDKRFTQLYLTDKGKEIYQILVPRVLKKEQELLTVLSDNEQKDLNQLLDKLQQNATLLLK